MQISIRHQLGEGQSLILSPLHGIVLPQLINCIDTILANKVV